ncbi:MAG: alginate lyase family protein [bacterium]
MRKAAFSLFMGVVLMAPILSNCRGESSELYPAVSSLRAHPIAETSQNYDCEAWPLPKKSLKTVSKYKDGDQSRSIIDPEKEADYDKEMERLVTYVKGVVKASNSYVHSGERNRQAALCAANWLDAWARKNAMTNMESKQAFQARESRLAALALAYSQIRHEPMIEEAQRNRIDGWLRQMAYDTIWFYEMDPHRVSYKNNHRYWGGLAAAATGYAIEDRALREWGYDSYLVGVAQIDESGYLPLELERASRAFEYHLYAAAPLMMIAEIAKTDNIDLYKEEEEAIHRLANVLVVAINDRSEFSKRAGAVQLEYASTNGKVPSYKLGWLEIYLNNFKTRQLEKLADEYRPIKATGLGGDITLLFTAEKEKK